MSSKGPKCVFEHSPLVISPLIDQAAFVEVPAASVARYGILKCVRDTVDQRTDADQLATKITQIAS